MASRGRRPPSRIFADRTGPRTCQWFDPHSRESESKYWGATMRATTPFSWTPGAVRRQCPAADEGRGGYRPSPGPQEIDKDPAALRGDPGRSRGWAALTEGCAMWGAQLSRSSSTCRPAGGSTWSVVRREEGQIKPTERRRQAPSQEKVVDRWRGAEGRCSGTALTEAERHRQRGGAGGLGRIQSDWRGNATRSLRGAWRRAWGTREARIRRGGN